MLKLQTVTILLHYGFLYFIDKGVWSPVSWVAWGIGPNQSPCLFHWICPDSIEPVPLLLLLRWRPLSGAALCFVLKIGIFNQPLVVVLWSYVYGSPIFIKALAFCSGISLLPPLLHLLLPFRIPNCALLCFLFGAAHLACRLWTLIGVVRGSTGPQPPHTPSWRRIVGFVCRPFWFWGRLCLHSWKWVWSRLKKLNSLLKLPNVF